ncbi:MAG TPA: hypothetical protein VLV18_05160 [Terriglobales bacterium]|nr:hypothetical protein [Terriglobales bacterium]
MCIYWCAHTLFKRLTTVQTLTKIKEKWSLPRQSICLTPPIDLVSKHNLIYLLHGGKCSVEEIVVECENLAKCKFFSFISTSPQGQSAAAGFVAKYCKGDYATSCVRRKVSKAFGGPQDVPDNMLPNGFPLGGTTTNNWSDVVKGITSQTTR